MTLEDLLTEITEHGWYVYSLHQTGDNRYNQWETTLRHAPTSTAAFGAGPTAKAALTLAIESMERAQPHDLPTYTTREESRVDLRSLLNLKPDPIKRRKL